MKRFNTTTTAFLFTLFVPLLAVADEAAVRKTLSDYVNVFNAKAADKVAGFWTKNGTHTDRETGQRTEGREAIQSDMTKVLSEQSDLKLSAKINRLRFITSDVASVEGETTLAVGDEESVVSAFTAIVVNQSGRWLLDSIEEMALPNPETAADALQDLEWLIGEWIDDSDDIRVTTTFRWTANQGFLLRSFDVETKDGVAMTGTQVIGWDPQNQQIRGWSFNSDGSFGESTWSRNGESWLYKSAQTLATGEVASGTYVMERLDDNSFSVQLVGHEVDGEPQPAGTTIRVVRAEPQSEAASSPQN